MSRTRRLDAARAALLNARSRVNGWRFLSQTLPLGSPRGRGSIRAGGFSLRNGPCAVSTFACKFLHELLETAMTVIALSVAEAVASGESHYATGIPCKRGHLSLRLVANSTCLECQRLAAEKKRAYDIEYRPEYAARKTQLRRERWGATIKRAHQQRIKMPDGWLKHALGNVRHRAKKSGIECSITYKDLYMPDVCPVLGIPIEIKFGERALYNPNSPSIDRTDNSKGYIPGNVRVISLRANLLKKDATLDEIRKLLKYMEGEVL